ncbi:MAG: TonB-dependent receptor [Syntrophomonadaceae bacterium]|nr:TonB-dependent receptor [Syntrophomonadaceae bacterium]
MKVSKILALCLMFLLVASTSFAQPIKVTGKVTDKADGQPLIGATVLVAGTSTGTSTDLDGSFELTVPAGSQLEVSYLGYLAVNVIAAPVLNIQMEEDQESLAEVVVTGYMTEKKADLTGSVAVVKMKEVADIPTGNVMTALQGRVAGMNVISDGTPGGQGTSSLIRGTTTINNSSPLYVIDGVMTRSDIGTIISSNDIESIQVLKDAASAAIYGAQAANGVIIITTKQAKEGAIKIDFSMTQTLQTFQNNIPLLNAQEWGDVYWAAYQYDFNTTPKSIIYGEGATAQLKLGQPYYSKDGLEMLISDTDWLKECYQNALMQTYNLSMSKGTKDHVSSMSLNYIDQDGVLKKTDYKSFTTRINNEYRFLNNKLRVGESVNISYWTQHRKPNAYESIEKQLLAQHPAQAVYASDGSYAGSEVDLLGSRNNPIRYIDNESNNTYTSWRIFGNAYIEASPIKNLVLRSSFGINYNANHIKVFEPAWDEHVRSNLISSLYVTESQNLEWVWTNTASYNLNVGKHSASFLLGAEYKKNRAYNLTGNGDEYALTTPDYVYLSVAEGTKGVTETANLYAMTSYFAKANYSFANKYLLSATVRRDASSRFGSFNNAGIFPSASAGWRISGENFMSGTKGWLSELKLRFSWGRNGNDQISNTATYNIYAIDIWNGSYNLNGDGRTLSMGAVRSQSGNALLRWEQTEQYNIGLDAGFLNDRLTMSIDYYDKNTTDMLYQLPVPAVNGEGGSSYQNCASMNNKGLEGILSWRNTVGDFSYEFSANLTWQKNAITYLPEDLYYTYGLGNMAAGITNVGLPYGGRIGYITDGVFRTQAEVDQYKNMYDVQFGVPGVGRIKYTDVNGDGKITTSDQAFIGSDLPVFQGGLNFSASYKNFDISMFFNGMVRKAYNTSKLYTDFFPLGEGLGNHSKRLLEAMQGYYDYIATGTYTSNYAALTTLNVNNENLSSDWYVEDGSFIKLKNLVIGYTIPENVLKTLKLRSARVYVQAQNVFTITNYTGPDPEALGYPYPFARSYVFGINFGF